MKWQGRRGSSNVRSSRGGGKMIGGGIGGIIIAGILWLVFGVGFWGQPHDGITDRASGGRRWRQYGE